MDLNKLFNPPNPKCAGCSLLSKPMQCHTILDYEFREPVDILFISDYPKMYQGDFVAFRPGEYKLIKSELQAAGITNEKIGFTFSVKCPIQKSDEINKKDMPICRYHLEDTIKQYNPKLIFACGKLATDMLFGKSIDVGKRRGKLVDIEIDGKIYKASSIFHPWQVIAEPKNSYLFNLDIRECLEDVILGRVKKTDFVFIPIHSISDLAEHSKEFLDTENPISIDIETTGLNFLEDTVHTIALSLLSPDMKTVLRTISMPLDHKDAKYGLAYKVAVCDTLSKIVSNPKNRKILQNCKFDIKFMMNYGISIPKNIWDTKLMQHIYSEEIPRSLSDLVKYHFPGEI